MNSNSKEDAIILKIRQSAGQLGDILKHELPDEADAEHYEFQVHTGLAHSVVEILDRDPSKLVFWFGYCLTSFGLDIDPRIDCLLDSLKREIEDQINKIEKAEDFD